MIRRLHLILGRRAADAPIMDQSATPVPPRSEGRRLAFQNVMLAAIAGLLALNLADQGRGPSAAAGLMSPPEAMAQRGESESIGLANAIQQRKDILQQLRSISAQLDRLDHRLNSGLSVKVTDMPALQLPTELRASLARPGSDPAATGAPTPPAPGQATPPPGIRVRPAP